LTQKSSRLVSEGKRERSWRKSRSVTASRGEKVSFVSFIGETNVEEEAQRAEPHSAPPTAFSRSKDASIPQEWRASCGSANSARRRPSPKGWRGVPATRPSSVSHRDAHSRSIGSRDGMYGVPEIEGVHQPGKQKSELVASLLVKRGTRLTPLG
jgi:hypothetical protein